MNRVFKKAKKRERQSREDVLDLNPRLDMDRGVVSDTKDTGVGVQVLVEGELEDRSTTIATNIVTLTSNLRSMEIAE